MLLSRGRGGGACTLNSGCGVPAPPSCPSQPPSCPPVSQPPPRCYPSPGVSGPCPSGAAWTSTDPSHQRPVGWSRPIPTQALTPPGSAQRHKGIIWRDDEVSQGQKEEMNPKRLRWSRSSKLQKRGLGRYGDAASLHSLPAWSGACARRPRAREEG